MAVGISGTESGPSGAVTLLYTVTGILADRFDTAVNFVIPVSGLSHAFDTASLLAIDSLFFATLAVTKVALWYAGRGRSGLQVEG